MRDQASGQPDVLALALVHEAALHTRHYLDQRDQYLASTEVDWLTLQTGKGTDE